MRDASFDGCSDAGEVLLVGVFLGWGKFAVAWFLDRRDDWFAEVAQEMVGWLTPNTTRRFPGCLASEVEQHHQQLRPTAPGPSPDARRWPHATIPGDRHISG